MRCLLAAIRCEKGDVAGNLAAQLRILADAAAAAFTQGTESVACEHAGSTFGMVISGAAARAVDRAGGPGGRDGR